MNVEEQLRRAAVDVDALPSAPSVAWTDIVARADTLRRRRTARRVGVLAATLALVGVIAVAGVVRGAGTHRVVTGGPTSPSNQTGWRVFDTGPLTSRSDEVEVWTGHELILWGGSTGGRSRALADGAAFTPQTGTWRRLDASPLAARQDAIGVWTGTRLLVVGGKNDSTALADGAAYDPTRRTWTEIAPIPNGAAASVDPRLAVWTGQRLLLPNVGLAYQPSDNRWSTLARPPAHQITFQTALWTGRDVIMIGIGAAPKTSGTTAAVALAYHPTTNRWRNLPPSGMDTAAIAATWDGTRVVVVSYDMRAATYQPTTNTWQPLPTIPLRFYECSPSAFTIAGHAYAQMCSGLAELDNHNTWTPIAYPAPLWGPGPVVATDNAALVWGSAFPTSDSRYTPKPVAEYTPGNDKRHEVLVGLAITTVPPGYTATNVDGGSTATEPTITAHIQGPHGVCTISTNYNGVDNGAAAELNRLDQLTGATRQQPPPTHFPGGPDFSVEVPPTAHDPQHHLAWALTSTDTVNIGCQQPSLLNQLARATRLNPQG
jgi:hypothetical protein